MFYSGGDYEPVPAPQGLPGAAEGAAVEGLRMRPGLAMSQVGGMFPDKVSVLCSVFGFSKCMPAVGWCANRCACPRVHAHGFVGGGGGCACDQDST